MAFPTSPSNNQVHKEGNRTFVWDSTLGTWDQVKETDSISAGAGGGVGNFLGGTIGSDVIGTLGTGLTFPTGHIIQTKYVVAPSENVYTTTNGSWNAYVTNLALSITRTAGTKFIYMVFGGRYDNEVDSRIFKLDVVRSTGSAWGPTNGLRLGGDSTNGISSIGQGESGEKNTDPQSLVGIDTTAVSGNYTYAPVFTGTDGGGQYFNRSNGGTQLAIGMEFIG